MVSQAHLLLALAMSMIICFQSASIWHSYASIMRDRHFRELHGLAAHLSGTVMIAFALYAHACTPAMSMHRTGSFHDLAMLDNVPTYTLERSNCLRQPQMQPAKWYPTLPLPCMLYLIRHLMASADVKPQSSVPQQESSTPPAASDAASAQPRVGMKTSALQQSPAADAAPISSPDKPAEPP